MLALGLALAAGGLTGCDTFDSYADPSVVGYWEVTPTRVPILTSLASIEDPTTDLVEITEIQPTDLLPEADTYRVGAGDFLNLIIYDIIVVGQPEFIRTTIDSAGYIEIPAVGQVYVAGMTTDEMIQAIGNRVKRLVADPTITVSIEQRRSQTFHLLGAVQNPGPYLIPAADHRILQALVAAGGFPEFVREVYVIRQVPLTPEAAGLPPEGVGDTPQAPDTGTPSGNGTDNGTGEIIDLIDDLTRPEDDAGGAPSAFARQPASNPGRDPVVDLLPPAESDRQDVRQPQTTTPAAGASPRWRFERGRWVRVAYPAGPAPGSGNDRDGLDDASMFTQRVIRVPVAPLVAGDASVNIVVRPGDVIRVPPNPAGNVYVAGQVSRPGVYQLPGVGQLTLTRAITAAGGLNGVAIPERVDLTRMVGRNEQAIIMLDLRAIEQGAQPDVLLKPDDRINVGTNFWATPLAVLRNGFRTNYGFGFLLDRNFGNDVFGAPPNRNSF